MASVFKSVICKKFIQAVKGANTGRKIKSSNVLPLIKICPKSSSGFFYEIRFNEVNSHSKKIGRSFSHSEIKKNIEEIDHNKVVEHFPTDDIVTAAYLEEKTASKLLMRVCSQKFVSEVLNSVCSNPNSFWKDCPLLALKQKQKVVVEFSSPNIAKPFHMGHLRSTIIGNFISNVHEALGHQVTRINYLGDWGTQFGLLKYGYDLKHMTEDDLKDNAIKSLYDLYVWINRESQNSEEILLEAKKVFSEMEKGDSSHLATWKMFRNLSITAYEKVYERLNVYFDEYHGESMYNIDNCDKLVCDMEKIGILKEIKDGRKVYKSSESTNNAVVTLVKSDGSTMYITRDISAAIHRFEQFKFDKMFYVVDNSQHGHFSSLVHILKDLGMDWFDRLEHVKFGRIEGMSTRKGTAVFLEDVLDEAKELMVMKQESSKNTSLDDPNAYREVADVVGASAIIVSDLKRRRKKNYTFSWDSALQNSGNTGVRLQYTHCRLVRLERKCELPEGEVSWDSLVEAEAHNVVRCIARYEEALQQSFEELESCILLQYLFELCDATNLALKALPVKGSETNVAMARLKLFMAARSTLSAGMKVLGLRPLDQM